MDRKPRRLEGQSYTRVFLLCLNHTASDWCRCRHGPAIATTRFASTSTKNCHYCAEEIRFDAVLCRFCEADLSYERSSE